MFCDKRVKYILRQNLSILTSFSFVKKDARSSFEGKTQRILAREKITSSHLSRSSQRIQCVFSANYIAHYANRVRLAYVSRHFQSSSTCFKYAASNSNYRCTESFLSIFLSFLFPFLDPTVYASVLHPLFSKMLLIF